MAADRDALIASINEQIADLQDQVEFLTDSDNFYTLDVGIGDQTIKILDFNSLNGEKFITTNNSDKLTEKWYENWAGFLSSDTTDFPFSYGALRGWLKMFRIHKFIYPTGLPFADQGTLDLFTHVIQYDSALDNFKAVDLGGTYPADRDNQFYFNSNADAVIALNHMLNSSDSTDDSDLREFFGINY